jgi:hypothetical protein
MKGLQHAKAFVVQFRSAEEGAAGGFSGRVEHVASGRTATFQSIDDLPQLLLTLLRSIAPDEKDGSE